MLEKENTKYFRSNWSGYDQTNGLRGKIKGIVLHDAAAGMGATAESVAKHTYNSMENANYHFSVDDKGNVYSVVGEDQKAYHCGDGPNGFGNGNCLGVEIAPSLTGGNFNNQAEKDKYLKAWDNACQLIADLCKKYKLSANCVKQHRQFSSTACPYSMKQAFGSYEKALSETIKKVDGYIIGNKPNPTPTPKPVYRDVAKVKYDLRGSRFDQNGKDWYLMEFVHPTEVWLDFECTKQDTAGHFQKGQLQVSYSAGKNKKEHHVHAFVSSNGKTYYYYYRYKTN